MSDHFTPYKLGDPVVFRLSKERADILHLLNEKKRQGIQISDYLATLIRQAESIQPHEFQVAAPPLDEDKLLERLLARLVERGWNPPGQAAEPSEESQPDPSDQNSEIKDIVNDILSWDD